MATIYDPKTKIFILYLGDIYECFKFHGLHTNVNVNFERKFQRKNHLEEIQSF